MIIIGGTLSYNENDLNTLKTFSNIDIPFFYLKGAINYIKLNYFFKKFVPIIDKDIAKGDKELLDLFKKW